MFNRFYRTDESRTCKQGDWGLAIAKEFVLAHDGTIDVESTPGQGTTFIVKLPY
ncbi:ATP-binding protein [Parageobacillus toebii]|uniref:ATP-binding protein n=1 Tax=Parageobacillus toebii TaxID=153151 RepID=UPI00399C6AC0